MMPSGWGECGACGRGLISFAPGRLRASCLPALGPCARCIAGSGIGVAGKPAALAPSPTKPRLKLSLGDHEFLWREPWWNAGRRARPQAEGGASRSFGARPHAACVRVMKHCVCRRSASFSCRKRALNDLFVARVSEAKPGIGIKAERSSPDVAPLIRATLAFLLLRHCRA